MNSIIHYLLIQNQYLLQIISYLFNFICKYIPLRQQLFDDSNSPKYQKFKVDEPPLIINREVWHYKDFIKYIKWRYDYDITPVKRRSACDIPDNAMCPYCHAPKEYLYKNNGSHNQLMCKVCGRKSQCHSQDFSSKITLRCPHCSHALVPKKDRKHFIIHKCVNPKCPYYLHNLKKVDKKHLDEPFGKNKYKLHYIYREFTVDFFKMDISSLPKNASSLKFSKHNAYIMSLCLTFHVNLGLSLRKTAQALSDLYNIKISHQQVANYARTASLVIKPFVDNFDYESSNTFTFVHCLYCERSVLVGVICQNNGIHIMLDKFIEIIIKSYIRTVGIFFLFVKYISVFVTYRNKLGIIGIHAVADHTCAAISSKYTYFYFFHKTSPL